MLDEANMLKLEHRPCVSEQACVYRAFALPAASPALFVPTPAAHVAGQMTDD